MNRKQGHIPFFIFTLRIFNILSKKDGNYRKTELAPTEIPVFMRRYSFYMLKYLVTKFA
jgi:hypothetical protein